MGLRINFVSPLIDLKTPQQQKKNKIFTITAIGRLDGVKGFDILIRQARRLSIDFHLQIIGEGPEKENLSKLISELDLDNKITLMGHRENIADLMHNSHLVVVSSHGEGFSFVQVEGMLYAPVIISTPVGIAQEIFPADLLVDQQRLAQKITEVWTNYDQFTELVQKTRNKHLNSFSHGEIANKYLNCYRDILEKTQ